MTGLASLLKEKACRGAPGRSGDRPDRASRFFVVGDRGVIRVSDYGRAIGLLRERGEIPQIDRRGLAQYLAFGHTLGPYSLIRGIGVLPFGSGLHPMHCDTLDGPDKGADSIAGTWRPHQWARAIRRQLESAVERHLDESARPALLLSGGFDSTLIGACIAAKRSDLATWSVGFGETNSDGAPAFRAAQWLRARHRHLHLAPQDVINRLRGTVRRLGLPTGNPSSMATDLAAETIAPEADVLFSGLGSDELFGGHYKHVFARYWPVMQYVAAARVWSRTFRQAGRAPHKIFSSGFAEGYREFYHLVTPEVIEDLFGRDRYHGRQVLESEDPGDVKGRSVFEIDRNCWLLSGLVPQAVRLAAAHDIGLALPFCDPSLQAAMRHLPLRLKVKGLTGKWILRRAYAGEIPSWVAKQPRAGFALPLARWLRGPLKGLLEKYLNREVVAARGLFNPYTVQGMVEFHLKCRADFSLSLWSLISLEIWQRIFID